MSNFISNMFSFFLVSIASFALLYTGECLPAVRLPDQNLGCQPCGQGQFVLVNCSRVPEGGRRGVSCGKCRDCSGEGKKTVTACTVFFDAECGCEDGYNMNSNNDCQINVTVTPPYTVSNPYPTTEPKEPIIMVAVGLVLITVLSSLAVVLICLRRQIFNKGFYIKKLQER